jgi:hypothetical protein
MVVPYVLHEIRAFFGASLSAAALDFHAVALSLLMAAWTLPVLGSMFRRLFKQESEIEWVSLWRCPQCSTFNRRSFTHCTHCDYSLKVGGAGKWIHDLYEWSQKKGQRGMRIYKVCGGILFYALTVFAFVGLKLYRLRQNPLLELTASGTLILLLISLLYIYLALRPRFKSPLSAVLDLSAGVGVAVLAGFSALLWVEAVPANPSLAQLHTLPHMQIELRTPGGAPVLINATPAAKALAFDLQYVVLTWPLMGIQHFYATRFSGKPLCPDWLLGVVDRAASNMRRQDYYRPQLTVFQQSFQVNPGSAYVFEVVPGKGLTLQKNKSLAPARP